MTTDEDGFGPSDPHWMCEECGHRSDKPLPKNREAFYAKRKAHICPKCKSESLMPRGW